MMQDNMDGYMNMKRVYDRGIEFLKEKNFAEALKCFFVAADGDYIPGYSAAYVLQVGSRVHAEKFGMENFEYKSMANILDYLRYGAEKEDEICTMLLAANYLNWLIEGDGIHFIDNNLTLSDKYGTSIPVSIKLEDIPSFEDAMTEELWQLYQDFMLKVTVLRMGEETDTEGALKLLMTLVERKGSLAENAVSFITDIVDDNQELWGQRILTWAQQQSNEGNAYAKTILSWYYIEGWKPVAKNVDLALQLAKEAGNIPQAEAIIRNHQPGSTQNNSGAGKRSGGCYVATAVYGSYDCPPVWILRRYRDHDLANSWYGRCFIKLYYAVSPTIVKLFGTNKWFQRFWRTRLDKLVSNLKEKGYDDKPYEDQND